MCCIVRILCAALAGAPLAYLPASARPSAVFRFSQPVPIPPYLLALAVGDLVARDLGPRSCVWSEPSMVEAGKTRIATFDFLICVECKQRRWRKWVSRQFLKLQAFMNVAVAMVGVLCTAEPVLPGGKLVHMLCMVRHALFCRSYPACLTGCALRLVLQAPASLHPATSKAAQNPVLPPDLAVSF